MGKKLLIVDDDQELLQLFLRKFQKIYDVITALNGTEALDKALNEKPDLIILDLLLPDMSGHEVCKRLKADEKTEPIPILFLTGVNNASSIIESFDYDANNYLTKPISPKNLSHYIEEALTS